MTLRTSVSTWLYHCLQNVRHYRWSYIQHASGGIHNTVQEILCSTEVDTKHTIFCRNFYRILIVNNQKRQFIAVTRLSLCAQLLWKFQLYFPSTQQWGWGEAGGGQEREVRHTRTTGKWKVFKHDIWCNWGGYEDDFVYSNIASLLCIGEV
jgi:hypothetical protein